MKNLYRYLIFAAITFTVVSCRKAEVVNADFSNFNPDNPQTNTALDQWLKTNFLDAYNIEVIYRYNRYYHGTTANVTPADLADIQPTMQAVIDGFISPYRKVAGEDFTKKYMPKEFVLFGSYSYLDKDDPGVAGTAAGGRRISLYGLNDYEPLPQGKFYLWDRQRIMHHEFGHILNQIVPIPPEFQNISKGFYKQPYDKTSTEDAHQNGFVTSYASGAYTEDYAETISWSLINGQAWYDNWANTASADGKKRLIEKQQNVIAYYNSLGVSFKTLQREVQLYMRSIGMDESKFSYWLSKENYSSMPLDYNSAIYAKYGKSAAFDLVYNGVKTNIVGMTGYNLVFNTFKIDFTSATTMSLELSFSQGANSFVANYPFNMAIDAASGEVKFTIVNPNPSGNEGLMKPAMQPILNYLTGNTFVADWLPVNVDADNYMKFGGFYVKGNPGNYFYGPLIN